VPLSTKCL